MNEKWIKLVENYKENGYEPEDIQMIVHFYDVMMETHGQLKKLYEEEKDERKHSDTLHNIK
ncbi:hypothetical protein P5G62_015345 [Neobacillus sp. 179-C4.2 HS]|uniref:Transcriptional regulator n=1 Tax=Neobacillus driksii TaxID=3035913 RepID=A0ABV4YUI6_9BACI|nr:hypothetical protein [Neobacillus sp. 179.-C4.2 HS]MDP5192740.1 hypothetical protein [Neobacillus sp. 179.-C4.2 HS]